MRKIIFLTFITMAFSTQAQKVIPLYQGAIPNSKSYPMKEVVMKMDGEFFGYQKTSVPTLAVYLPDKKNSTGVGVIVCPGGAYEFLSYKLEGIKIAGEFVKHGVAAFILKYRLPSDSIMQDKSIGPLQDAQQAIKMVREHAGEWGVNPRKIGIMGFSAGGHVASTAGTHYNKSYIPNKDSISLRPDFMILVYPVISMQDSLTHPGSRTNLLGPSPSKEMIDFFSNDRHVTADTPPTWLTQTGDDSLVPVDNSIIFYRALIRHKVPAEMLLYPKGDHGFVLKIPTHEWMAPLFKWMKESDIIE